MSVIRRLIFKEWYKAFWGGVAVLLILFSSGNLVAGLLRGNVSVTEVMINYILELPTSLGRILPASCLIASIFSLNKLRNRNELTAILASGFTPYKFLSVIVQASACVAVAQFIILAYCRPFLKGHKDFFIPQNSGLFKFRSLQSKGLRASTITSGKVWYKGTHYFFSFLNYDKAKKILSDVSLYYFDQNYKLEKYIHAKKIVHRNDNIWNFIDGISYSYLNLNSFPEVKTFERESLLLDESPADFDQLEADITTLIPSELLSYIDQLKNVGINTAEYEVMLYDKFSQALICIIFALLASSAIFNPNRRTSSPGKNIFFIVFFIVGYWLIYFYFLELGKNSKLNQYAACFLMPLLLSGAIVYYLRKKQAV
ncbi:MAG: LptF/LptG family permease [Halobacteriovoraceae bacterium]|nr:LptF/LptG family permease [Halobacteriovoraceae bacterium]